MKQIYLFAVIVVVLCSGYVWYRQSYHTKNNLSPEDHALWDDYTVTTMDIQGQTYRLVVADTPQKWEQGLMYLREPSEDFDGMVFQFVGSTSHTFWNKNTYLDLKLYWMQDDRVVGESNLPAIDSSNTVRTVQSPGPVDTVVEIIEKK